MSAPPCEVVAQKTAGNPMGVFERYLTVWVFLCILTGIGLGSVLPQPFQFIGGLELAKVNIPVAVLIWLMIIPMLLKIDFSALAGVRRALARDWRHPVRQLGSEAVFHGLARLAVHPGRVCASAAGRAN